MKILVVDDEPDVRLLFEQKFRAEIKNGLVELVYALSAEEALSKLADQQGTDVVLILSDINMPGMNGLDLLKVLKSEEPDRRVFMITAYGDDETFATARTYGADDYITKPIDFTFLKERILGN